MKTKTLLMAIFCLATIVGCKKQLDEGTSPPQLSKTVSTNNPKNPYSVTNMRKAFANLLIADVQLIKNNKLNFTKGKIMFTESNQTLSINKQLSTAQGTAIATNGINATHYYIKFIPRNDADYALLKKDTNLVIYPFPLDNEVSPYTNSYRDPAVAAGVPTYQYAAVPVAYILPNVPYQKLEDLYLPDEQNKNSLVTLRGEGGSYFTIGVQQLVNQAICDVEPVESFSKTPINNNTTQAKHNTPPVISLLPPEDPDPCDGTSGGSFPPDDEYRNGESWRPHGRITVYDDVLGQTIGVEGIRVKVYRWFTTYTGITDANGYYAVDGWYTRSANYWFQFERYDFSVNDHGGGPQEVSGPNHTEAAWNEDLTGYNKFCATIFRAAYHYYYKDIQGLIRPPQNSFWGTQVKIGAFEGTHYNNTALYRNGIFGELIKIYTNPGQNQASDELYATTIHELAHAVHWQMFNPSMDSGLITAYSFVDNKVCESWATGVQYALTRMVYPLYYGRLNKEGTDYKNVVLDMLDTSTEVSYYQSNPYTNRGFGAPQDLVDGYTILQIENSLHGQTEWNEWKINIKNLYNNGTENNLDALFDAWYNF